MGTFRPAQGRGVGPAEHQTQDVDPAAPPLRPQALREDEVERLGRAVRGERGATCPCGAGGHQDHGAALAGHHRAAEAVRGFEYGRAVALHQPQVGAEVLVEERDAAVVAARVVDEQTDLKTGRRLLQLRQRAGGAEVERDGTDLHAVPRADLVGGGLQHVQAPGHQHDVYPLGGQPVGERGTHPVRPAGDDTPRPVCARERFSHLVLLVRGLQVNSVAWDGGSGIRVTATTAGEPSSRPRPTTAPSR